MYHYRLPLHTNASSSRPLAPLHHDASSAAGASSTASCAIRVFVVVHGTGGRGGYSKSLIPTMYVDGWAARVHDDVNLVVLAIMALMAAWSMWK